MVEQKIGKKYQRKEKGYKHTRNEKRNQTEHDRKRMDESEIQSWSQELFTYITLIQS